MPQRALYIVIEGVDGAGTTTVAQAMARHLGWPGSNACCCRPNRLLPHNRCVIHSPKVPAVWTFTPAGAKSASHRISSEAGTTQTGDIIRQGLSHKRLLNPRTMASLFIADHLVHSAFVVEPKLALGQTVIQDRGHLSTWVYQYVLLKACDFDQLEQACGDAAQPDVTIYLQVTADVARSRQHGRQTEMFDDNIEALVAAYDSYVDVEKKPHLDGAAVAHGKQLRIVDASQPLDEVVVACLDIYKETLYGPRPSTD